MSFPGLGAGGLSPVEALVVVATIVSVAVLTALDKISGDAALAVLTGLGGGALGHFNGRRSAQK